MIGFKANFILVYRGKVLCVTDNLLQANIIKTSLEIADIKTHNTISQCSVHEILHVDRMENIAIN